MVIPFNRNQLKDQLLMASSGSSTSAAFLLESLVMLIEPQVSWSCKIVAFLLQRNVYYLIREIIFTAKVNFSWPKGWYACACSCYMENLFFFLIYVWFIVFFLYLHCTILCSVLQVLLLSIIWSEYNMLMQSVSYYFCDFI